MKWIETHFFIEDRVDPVTGALLGPGPIILAEHQKRILAAALERDGLGRFRWSTVVYSAPKKSGKTRVAAAVAAWMAAQFGPFAEIYALANDGKQSEDRILSAIEKCLRLNSALGLSWRVERRRILLPDGSFIEALPVDPAGESGANPTMTVFSELWGYGLEVKERFWSSMTISPARQGRALRWVESYAGYEGESPVLERLFHEGVECGQRHPDFSDLPVYINPSAGLFCYWDHQPRMPWQTEQYYQQEARLLTPQEFLRMHRNQWVSSTTAFVPIEWWDACREDLPPLQPRERVILGADAAVSGDSFGLVAVTRHPERKDDVAVRYARCWYPPKGGKIDFRGTPDNPGPELEIERLCRTYKVVEVAYDQYQLHRTATDMRRKRIVHWRPFGQTEDRLVADGQLYQLIRDRRIAHSGQPDLRQHILNANAKTARSEDTRLRIVKKHGSAAIDLVVALSMAAARCLELRL